MREWFLTYAPRGLMVIGVHSPGSMQERDMDRLVEVMDEWGTIYPVVADNSRQIWRAYKNRFWPTLYVIDKSGHIRYVKIGRGQEAYTTSVIEALLAE